MKVEPTTERIIEENYQSSQETYVILSMHLATYNYCVGHVTGKKVLDYGCGSGYGTALISKSCSQVIGVDISSEAISYAQSHYAASNLSYQQIKPAEVAPLPFPNASFDIVLSFQVIEHVQNVPDYLREIERVLVPGGLAIIATPDRINRLFSFQKPWNMWHLREYAQDQLRNALVSHFSDVNVQQMGGRREALETELNRTRRLKWILLPVTLPFIPELIRRNSLQLIKQLNYNLPKRENKPEAPSFDETALSISNNEKNSIFLLATAKK